MAGELDPRERSPRPLYYLQIPKSGCGALVTVLEAQFARSEICPWRTIEDLRHVPREDWQGYRLYHGVFGTELSKVLEDAPSVVTMVREPVAGAIAALHEGRRSASWPTGLTLSTYLRGLNARDLGTRILERLVPGGRAAVRRMSDDESIGIALETLDSCTMVGVSERVSDFAHMLSQVRGWAPPVDVRAADNAVCESEPLTSVDLEIVREIVDVETPIYRHAQELFDARWRVFLRRLLDDEHRRRLARQTRRDRIVVDLDGPVPGTGWHASEGLVRWTGPGTSATLDLRLEQGRDLRLIAHVVDAARRDVLDSLELFVNDMRVDLQMQRMSDRQALIAAPIPRVILQRDPELVRLRFSVARTSPRPGDGRSVGVCFGQIAVTPHTSMSLSKA